MAEVNSSLWFDQQALGPGASQNFFEDNVSEFSVRWFTAVPMGFSGVDTPFPLNDQLIEISDVFYILKGDQHNLDGSGEHAPSKSMLR